MAQVTLTTRARRDLREIIHYIALDKPATAKVFGKKIIRSIRRLRQFPLGGRAVPKKNDPNIREIIYRNYRIIYWIREHGIEVLTIHHSSRILYLS